MSSQQVCDSEMTDAEIIRAVYPRDTMKRLAQAADVPVDTARQWLYRNLSDTKRVELAKVLLADIDAEEARAVSRFSAARLSLARWLAEYAAEN